MLAVVASLLTLASVLPGLEWAERGLFQAADFDFQGLGIALAGISLGGIGVLMAGAFLFGERAEQAKRTWMPTTIVGIVLISVSGVIIAALGG